MGVAHPAAVAQGVERIGQQVAFGRRGIGGGRATKDELAPFSISRRTR